jgi:hypothetical protein
MKVFCLCSAAYSLEIPGVSVNHHGVLSCYYLLILGGFFPSMQPLHFAHNEHFGKNRVSDTTHLYIVDTRGQRSHVNTKHQFAALAPKQLI